MQVTAQLDLDGIGPGGAYATRRLGPPDLAALQALFVRSADYFEIATGRAPASDEAERAFVGGPPTRAVSDKLTVGVFVGDRLVGVLDAIPDFPSEGTCTMGLLLLDPAVRGGGVGAAVLETFERCVASAGARRCRTAVVAHHAPGLRFLERAGYRETARQEGYDAGATRPSVVILEKELRKGAG